MHHFIFIATPFCTLEKSLLYLHSVRFSKSATLLYCVSLYAKYMLTQNSTPR